MPIINIAPQNKSTDEVEQGISEVNQTLSEMKEKTGQANDTGGSTTNGSIFAKLNALLYQFAGTWTNARASKLDLLDNSTYGLSKIQGSIGTTSNTGGSASAGTLMAKVNRLIGTVDSIKSTNSRYTPKEIVKKTLLNTEVSYNGIDSKLIAKFMPDKDGVARLRISARVSIGEDNNVGFISIGVLNVGYNDVEWTYPYPGVQNARRKHYRDSYTMSMASQMTRNFLDYDLSIGTVMAGTADNGTQGLFLIKNKSYITADTGIELVKGIPLMIYLHSINVSNVVYCNLVQLLYEEV